MKLPVISAICFIQCLGFAIALWPMPAKMSTGDAIAWISPDVKTSFVPLISTTTRQYQDKQVTDIKADFCSWLADFFHSTERPMNGRVASRPSDAELIQEALKRFPRSFEESQYVPWKFHPKGSKYQPAQGRGTHISDIIVTQVASNIEASQYIDESYTLELSSTSANITAATAQGAMHALTTLSQLFYKSSHGGYYTTQVPVSIQDAPKFPWRGINMDIVRNYEPPWKVKRLIDGLAFNKFNRLHIHATDSQAWPLEIPSMPDLAAKGAYRPEYVWTAQDLEDVQSYAYSRGITAYVEIDTPGHTASIAWARPDLIVGYNQQPWATFCDSPPCGQVKLNSKATLKFFDEIAADLYPRVSRWSDVFHTGGDELNANIYGLPGSGVGSNKRKKIQPALQEFVSHLHKNVRAHGMKPMVWEEMLLEWNLTLEKDVVVQTWLGPDSIANSTSKGYKSLFGEHSWWYMDCGFGSWIDPLTINEHTPIKPPYTDYCSPYKSWREIYAYDPTANLTIVQQENVIGGEVHIWHELTDRHNLDGKVWPRASAAAELLWRGPAGTKGVNYTVTLRLADQRERMVAMGFEAALVQMTWCLQAGDESCAM